MSVKKERLFYLVANSVHPTYRDYRIRFYDPVRTLSVEKLSDKELRQVAQGITEELIKRQNGKQLKAAETKGEYVG